jgi:hypothetical protein
MAQLSTGFIDKIEQKINPNLCQNPIMLITKLRTVKPNEVYGLTLTDGSNKEIQAWCKINIEQLGVKENNVVKIISFQYSPDKLAAKFPINILQLEFVSENLKNIPNQEQNNITH